MCILYYKFKQAYVAGFVIFVISVTPSNAVHMKLQNNFCFCISMIIISNILFSIFFEVPGNVLFVHVYSNVNCMAMTRAELNFCEV